MTEIRSTPSQLFTPNTSRTFGPQISSPGPMLTPMDRSPLMRRGSVANLLGAGRPMSRSIIDAGPLLGFQSNVAAQITNPSGEQSEGGLDAWKGFKSGTTANAVVKGLTRATSRLGEGTRTFGSLTGLAGAAIALPGSISDAAASIEKARKTGDSNDIAKASADTSSAGSMGTRLVKHGIETVSIGSRAVVRRAGAKAFKQAVPGASKAVVKAASRQAASELIKDSSQKLVRRGATTAAKAAAQNAGTLAKGAGTVGRAAAKKALQSGGKAAATAAGKAIAKGGIKAGAKAAGRFVPGLNVAIAGLDTATAVATLADKNASTGKKATSVITAAGSIVAATNIPVVSQIGAAVSTVSSFIGSFF